MVRAIIQDQENERDGVIGEWTLGGFEGKHFFDVSAVDGHSDNTGVMHIYTAEKNKTAPNEWSGCYEFPCGNVYVLSDDPGTRVTESQHFSVEVGGHPSTLTKNAKDQARLPKIKQQIKEQKESRTKPWFPVRY